MKIAERWQQLETYTQQMVDDLHNLAEDAPPLVKEINKETALTARDELLKEP
jgi:hypothetical protein